MEVDWRLATGIGQWLLSASNGTTTNRAIIYTSGGDLRGLLTADGSNVGNLGASYSGFSGIQKIAFAYADSDYKLYRNGSSFATDATGSLAALATLTDIDLGQSVNESSQANMHIRAVALYKTRLTDDQLADLTS